MAEPALIDINELTFRRGKQPILNAFSATWKQPSKVAVIGPNGCGKSTLLELIAGQLRADSGQILINGLPARSAEAQNQVAWLSQNARPLASMNGLAFISWLQSQQSKAIDLTALSRALSQLALVDQLAQPISQLSKGNQQKLFALLTIFQQKNVLLMDEATSALDVSSRQLMLQLMQTYCRDRLVLFVTHQLEEIEQLADEILVFGNDGAVMHIAQLSEDNFWIFTPHIEQLLARLTSGSSKYLTQSTTQCALFKQEGRSDINRILQEHTTSDQSFRPQVLSFMDGLRQLIGSAVHHNKNSE